MTSVHLILTHGARLWPNPALFFVFFNFFRLVMQLSDFFSVLVAFSMVCDIEALLSVLTLIESTWINKLSFIIKNNK